MRDAQQSTASTFGRLARISMVGFAVQLLWLFLTGPVVLGRWDRLSTRISLALAVVLLAFVASSAFGRFVQSKAKEASLPAQVFTINVLSLILVGFFLLTQLQSNPHILGDTLMNASDAALLGGETILILLSFIANLIAFSRDRASE